MDSEAKRDLIKEGEQSYNEWKASLTDTPEKAALYREIAAQCDLWLQLVEARQAAGLTQRQLAKRLGVSQAQVARIEKQGYESYALTTLRRYLSVLGEGFSLEVKVRRPSAMARSERVAATPEQTALDSQEPHWLMLAVPLPFLRAYDLPQG